ncbi:hypothetical protein D3C80_2000690 [compost metagenome]
MTIGVLLYSPRRKYHSRARSAIRACCLLNRLYCDACLLGDLIQIQSGKMRLQRLEA